MTSSFKLNSQVLLNNMYREDHDANENTIDLTRRREKDSIPLTPCPHGSNHEVLHIEMAVCSRLDWVNIDVRSHNFHLMYLTFLPFSAINSIFILASPDLQGAYITMTSCDHCVLWAIRQISPHHACLVLLFIRHFAVFKRSSIGSCVWIARICWQSRQRHVLYESVRTDCA